MKNVHARAESLVKQLQARTPLLWINGLYVEAEGAGTIQVMSPIDGTLLGRVPAANEADVGRAVAAARAAAAGPWADSTPDERASLLWHAAELLEQDAQDLAVLCVLESGKTLREVLAFELAASAQALRYFAGAAQRRAGVTHTLGPTMTGQVVPVPHAVVGIIASWTGALSSAAWKCGAALAGGSTIVLKPSELTPFATLRLSDVFTKAGLPNGVLNVITGYGQPAGEALALHPGVDAVSFSGSIESARRVQLAAAKSNLKPVHLVLGGKSCAIVFEDASVQKAASAAWRSVLTGRGSSPTGCARLLVHESLYGEVLHIVTERARQIVVGDPLDDHTELGPVISEEHMKKVLAYGELGRREGAKLVAGGARDQEGSKATGFYVKPTVLMDATHEMRVAREPIPGPVLTVMKFKSEDEALAMANDTDYGFAAGVWTKDLARGQRMARRLKAGMVWINGYDLVDPRMPFGGATLASGGRDLGEAALAQYSSTKSIFTASR